jgi:hypothetical protein
VIGPIRSTCHDCIFDHRLAPNPALLDRFGSARGHRSPFCGLGDELPAAVNHYATIVGPKRREAATPARMLRPPGEMPAGHKLRLVSSIALLSGSLQSAMNSLPVDELLSHWSIPILPLGAAMIDAKQTATRR